MFSLLYLSTGALELEPYLQTATVLCELLEK